MELNWESLTVMVIDDSKTIRRTAETLLQKAGCTVVTATDGFDALAKIADSRRMLFRRYHDAAPGWLSNLRSDQNNSEFRSTPVVMLSSKDGLFDKAKGRVVGCDQYLTKPFSKSELLGAISAHAKPHHAA